MTPRDKHIVYRENFLPNQLPGLQAWYDLSQPSSYIIGTGVKLLGDLSGNSNTNVLALNGTTTNFASDLDSAPLRITGDIDLRCYVALDSWTPVGRQGLICKWNAGSNRAYLFQIEPTTGVIALGL